jgi:centromeric protein E
MEKEIKELKLQRDVAESRLQDLLKVVGDNHGSKHPLVDTLHYFLVDQLDCSFITKK